MPTVTSPTTKPVTASENVNVAVNASVLVAGTPVIVTVGAVLSTSYVGSFVPVGVRFVNALPSASSMFWSLANDSVTVAVRLARLPSDTVTSYTVVAVTWLTAVTVAVVPLTVKSAPSTFATSSLNVTRHFRLSAFVASVVGVCRSIDVTRGAAASAVLLVTAWPEKLAASLPARSLSVSSVPPLGFV